MKPSTRERFSQLRTAMAEAYGVTEQDVKETFSISEPMETKLNSAIQESSEFLQRIQVLPVTDKKGQAVTVGVNQSLAKRTDTANNDRQPTRMSDPTGLEYEVHKTEFDVAMPYTLVDAWARFEDFVQRYMNAVYGRIALDRIKIGWTGTSAASATNRTSNPNLEDVNIGWLKLLMDNAPQNYLLESTASSGKITLGDTGDYKNLDQLVYDTYSMIPAAHRSGSEVAIIGRQMVANDMGKVLAKHGQTPSERGGLITLDQSYGGLPALIVPHFPETGVLVTDTDNLHLYYQESGMRRQQVDHSKRDQVEDYISSNEAYFFEDFNAVAGIAADNVEFSD